MAPRTQQTASRLITSTTLLLGLASTAAGQVQYHSLGKILLDGQGTATTDPVAAMSVPHLVLGLTGVDAESWTVVIPRLSVYSVADLDGWYNGLSSPPPPSRLNELKQKRIQLLTAHPWLVAPDDPDAATYNANYASSYPTLATNLAWNPANVDSILTSNLSYPSRPITVYHENDGGSPKPLYVAIENIQTFLDVLFGTVDPEVGGVPHVGTTSTPFYWPATDAANWYLSPTQVAALSYLWAPAYAGRYTAGPADILAVDRILDAAVVLQSPDAAAAQSTLRDMPTIWEVGFHCHVQYVNVTTAAAPATPTTTNRANVPPPPVLPIDLSFGELGSVYTIPNGPGGCVFQPVVLGDSGGPGMPLLVTYPHSGTDPVQFYYDDGYARTYVDAQRITPIDGWLFVPRPTSILPGPYKISYQYYGDVPPPNDLIQKWLGPPPQEFTWQLQ